MGFLAPGMVSWVGGYWQEEENEKIVWHPKFLFANAAAMC